MNILETFNSKEKQPCPREIGCLGPTGTFSEDAAEKFWKRLGGERQFEPSFSDDIESVFKNVLNGNLKIGIVPIENTTGGPVRNTHRALEELDGFGIVGEVVLQIRQYLYCQYPEQVAIIASKDSALEQTANWRKTNYPKAGKIETKGTSAAVEMAAKDSTIGAIAGETAAKKLGLSNLKRTYENIEDNPANITTFVAISKAPELSEPTGNDKTSLILELSNRAGSLYSLLKSLSNKGINLSKIKSLRSSNGNIRFLISLDGHQQDENVKIALFDLEELSETTKILGSYAKDPYIPEIRVDPNMNNAVQMIKKEAQNGDANNSDTLSAVFTLNDKIGTLADVLKIFADKQINLAKIDSMPSGNFNEYIFYLSCDKKDILNRDGLIKELKHKAKHVVLL